jgi:hypothetical protein
MVKGLSLDGTGVYVAYDTVYRAETSGLRRIQGGRFSATLAEMERRIIATRGYPKGSLGVYIDLVRLFPQSLWQELALGLEKAETGNALRALRYIEGQRIYTLSGVAIVYSIVNHQSGVVLVFQTANLCDDKSGLDFLAKLVLTY